VAVEIEAKMKVANFDEVRRKLQELGAAKGAEIFEINAFFDTEDRSLLAADQGLRLRVNRDEATGKETYVYTFKGPRLHGKLKSREELELDVGDPKDAERFLIALGFQKILSFEKRRHKWKLDKCSIELDELPHLGVYVEVEGPDEPAVMRVRDQLGLGKAALIKSSYIAMLMAHLQESGSHERSVTFPK
jgi:adenylate cyclase, class 2